MFDASEFLSHFDEALAMKDSQKELAAQKAYKCAVMCYDTLVDPASSLEDRANALKYGQRAVDLCNSCQIRNEEYILMQLLFELYALRETRGNDQRRLWSLLAIKRECPLIEAIDHPIVNPGQLREWFNKSYYFLVRQMLEGEEDDRDPNLKFDMAMELKNSSDLTDQLVALAELSLSHFSLGHYDEAQRYAVLGKDRLGRVANFDVNDVCQAHWGVCWYVYAQCQAKLGEPDFAEALLEKGASMGIPQCVEALKQPKTSTVSCFDDWVPNNNVNQ